jgi:chromosome segregation ATPase
MESTMTRDVTIDEHLANLRQQAGNLEGDITSMEEDLADKRIELADLQGEIRGVELCKGMLTSSVDVRSTL